MLSERTWPPDLGPLRILKRQLLRIWYCRGAQGKRDVSKLRKCDCAWQAWDFVIASPLHVPIYIEIATKCDVLKL